jgi:hypothetical protein
MSKLVRILLIVIGALLILGFIGIRVMKKQTKKHSPSAKVELVKGDLALSVTYCRPYKRGRPIFGVLVPYGEVWRTGANEATTFSTSATIQFGDTPVEPGTYTLWTIPGETEWKVILNSKRYGWGVTWGGEASREAQHDVAQVVVPVEAIERPVEQFTIRLTDAPLAMVLEWDRTRVSVPLSH